MMITALLLAAIPVTPIDTASHPDTDASVCLGKKAPRDWVEIPQGVQYDGDWSPPAGRQPDPEPDAFTPVRRPAPWLKDIPVIVQPEPIYVTEQAPQEERELGSEEDNEAEINARVEEILRQRAEQEGEGQLPGAPASDTRTDGPPPPPATGARGTGSATGSKAAVTYSTTPNF